MSEKPIDGKMPEKIVRNLREPKCGTPDSNGEYECNKVMSAAADMIESMQSQLAEKNATIKRQQEAHAFWMCEEMSCQEQLKAQLAASQRRERAAAKDLESFMRESNELRACTYCGIDQSWGCSLHKTSSMCMPKWRGPQDGKGESE